MAGKMKLDPALRSALLKELLKDPDVLREVLTPDADAVTPPKLRRPKDGIKPVKRLRAVKALDPAWDRVVRRCPHCKRSGTVTNMFGVKNFRGAEVAQSWCYDCRSKTNYHNKPRKYDIAP